MLLQQHSQLSCHRTAQHTARVHTRLPNRSRAVRTRVQASAQTGSQQKTIQSVDAPECQEVIQQHCSSGSSEQGELVVTFTATWCGPCRLVGNELQKVLQNRPQLRVLSMDIEAPPNKDWCGDLGIKALPTVLFLGRDPKKPVICSQGQMTAKVCEDILDNKIHLSGADLRQRLVL